MLGSKFKSWVESHLPRPLRRKHKSKHKKDACEQEDRTERHRLTSRSNVELIFRLHQNNPIYSAETICGKGRYESNLRSEDFLSSPESAYSTGYSTEGLSPASVNSSGQISGRHKGQDKCSVVAASRKVHLSPPLITTPGSYHLSKTSSSCPASCSPRPRPAIRTNPWVPIPNRNSYESNTTDSSGIGNSSIPSSLKSRVSIQTNRYLTRTAVQRGVSAKCDPKYSDSLTDSPCSTISVDRETDILSDYESHETKDSTEDEALQRGCKQKVYTYIKQEDEAEKRYQELIKETQSILSFLQDERHKTPLRKPKTEPPSRRFLCQKMSISSSSEDERVNLEIPKEEGALDNHPKFKYSPPASYWSITESGRDIPARLKRRFNNPLISPNVSVDSCPNTPCLNRNSERVNFNVSNKLCSFEDNTSNRSHPLQNGISAHDNINTNYIPNGERFKKAVTKEENHEPSVVKYGRYVAVVSKKASLSCPSSPFIKYGDSLKMEPSHVQCLRDEHDVLATTRKMLEDEDGIGRNVIGTAFFSDFLKPHNNIE
ncbi:uncharacterized protein LOC136036461 isoform X2 [Artemia franciscana]|uniref:uncharacterized protein LOC136036461 isoform X2 n=1 Tax=Artemia franciscana TaxID=6661 RepID=UPI0032DA9620